MRDGEGRAQREQPRRSRYARFAGRPQRGEFGFDVGALLRSWMRSRLISRIASLSISSTGATSISIVPLRTVAPLGDCSRKMG